MFFVECTLICTKVTQKQEEKEFSSQFKNSMKNVTKCSSSPSIIRQIRLPAKLSNKKVTEKPILKEEELYCPDKFGLNFDPLSIVSFFLHLYIVFILVYR